MSDGYPIYRFTKIKYKPATKEENPVNEYEFHYYIITGQHKDGSEINQKLTLVCNDEPVESFKTTLQALKPYITELCEQPKDYTARVTVRGINCKYGDHETGGKVLGVVMTGVYKYKKSNGVLVLNTPFKQESFRTSKGGDDGKLLSDDCLEVIYELFEEAKKYLKGERLEIKIDYKEQEKIDKAEKLENYKEGKKKSKDTGVDNSGKIIEMGNGK